MPSQLHFDMTRLPLLPILLILALVASGCSGSESADAGAEETGRTIRVETLSLDPTEFTDVIELTGTVTSPRNATLSAQTGGTVEMLARRGTRIGRGEVLARIDATELRAALDQAAARLESAQAQYDLAEDNYNRLEPLYRDSIISAVEFENTRTQYAQAASSVQQARAAVTQARERLSKATLRAPFSGTVETRFVEVGEQVNPGQPVAQILDADPVQVEAGVPERYSNDIEPGTPAEVVFSAYDGTRRQAPVSFVGSVIDPESRTFPIEIELNNSDRRLKPSMVARVLLEREQLEQVLVVPRAAIERDEEGDFVYIAAPASDTTFVAARRSVTTGPSYRNQVVVTSGLEAGARVIVAGQNEVAQGDALDVVTNYSSAERAREEPDSDASTTR